MYILLRSVTELRSVIVYESFLNGNIVRYCVKNEKLSLRTENRRSEIFGQLRALCIIAAACVSTAYYRRC